MYSTHFPCKDCSKLIYLSDIKKVFYFYPKKDKEVILFFKKIKVSIKKLII